MGWTPLSWPHSFSPSPLLSLSLSSLTRVDSLRATIAVTIFFLNIINKINLNLENWFVPCFSNHYDNANNNATLQKLPSNPLWSTPNIAGTIKWDKSNIFFKRKFFLANECRPTLNIAWQTRCSGNKIKKSSILFRLGLHYFWFTLVKRSTIRELTK